MTGQEAIAYIHGYNWQGHRPGLDRIRALLRALGDPQDQLRFIHVAGTNGKGSVCAMLASVLEAAGYRVGLNTSPYLTVFNERIQVNGQTISDEALGELTEQIRPAAEAMVDHPTEFELITAIALLYFCRQHCDVVVLEAGMGGALDASNVIAAPEAAVLTAMGMDHVAQLGPTLADIARAKSGIIKPGGAVVSLGGCPEADAVFQQVCREQDAALTEVDLNRLEQVSLSLTGGKFHFRPWNGLEIPLAGAYQLRNAALALTTLEVLAQKGWNIPPEAIRRGLAQVRWPGRMEVLQPEGPAILLDGAHNPQGVRAAVESLEALFPGQQVVFLLGVLGDKAVEEMLDLLAPCAAAAITVTPNSPRAMGAEQLRQRLLPRGVPACACVSVAEGLALAIQAAGADGAVCALGSLYMSADVRKALAKQTGAGA